MSLPAGIEDALDKLADGAPVDWDAVQEQVNSPEDSAIVRNLQILARLGETHRDDPDHLAVTRDDSSLDSRPGDLRSPLVDGSYWGRYRLIRIIGEGSYGTVYLARDEQLDREVALKFLHRQLVEHEDVKSEGRALARVEHANVLTVYGIEQHGGRLALCMKYVRGRTLEEIIRSDGPMNAEEALVVAKAVCSAVAAVHAAGILHRDIKARNVMRERNGRYVLMDFGAGVMQKSDGSSGRAATVGTPLYMAPELFDAAPASRKTDVYAVGVLLYFLVTGEYPINGDTVDALKAAHRGGRVRLDERRTELSDNYVRAVDAATSPDPAERPESIAALLRALSPRETILSDSRPAVPAWVRRVATTIAVVVALAILSGLLTSWTFNSIVGRPPEFDDSTYLDVIATGFRTLLFPTLVGGALFAFAAALQLFSRVVPLPKEWLRRGLLRILGSLPKAEYAAALAQLSIVIGLVSMPVLVWAFGDVFYAFIRPISYWSLDVYSVFRTESIARRVAYRLSVATLIVVTALVWRGVRSMQRTNGGAVPAWVRAAGVALVSLLALLSQAPYKAMFYNQVPVIVLDGARCYLLGEEGSAMRVFCPSNAVPRVRTVDSTRVTVERCGSLENIFAASIGTTCPPRTEQ